MSGLNMTSYEKQVFPIFQNAPIEDEMHAKLAEANAAWLSAINKGKYLADVNLKLQGKIKLLNEQNAKLIAYNNELVHKNSELVSQNKDHINLNLSMVNTNV
jgi:hypothetical protein